MMYAVKNSQSDPVRDGPRRVLSNASQLAIKSQNYFGCYQLCQATLDKLQKVDDLLEHDSCPADPGWAVIKPTVL